MSAAGFYRRVPLPVSGVLALVAALALCPSDGRAACGDYVTVVGAASADTPGHPAPACHGPGCSQAPTRGCPGSGPEG